MAHPFLGNAMATAFVAAAVVAEPPPLPDYVEWAKENVFFGAESPFKGAYNPDLFPFFTPILMALQPDDPCEEVSFKKSAQLGGTVLGQIFKGATMDLDPCPFMNTHPTVENARRYKKNKWTPFVKGNSRLKAVMCMATGSKSGGNRDSGDSSEQQDRKDGRGFVMWNGANSAASLSQHSIKKQIQDDLSKWVSDNGAGDPEEQAGTRSQAYLGKGVKIFKTSTPTLDKECRITKNFEAGTQEYWHVPCPHCGGMQTLDPENFIANINREHTEKSGFRCKHADCGELIEQKHRYEMNLQGIFIPKNPLAAKRSFFIWSAYSPLMPWKSIADRWLSAEGEAEAERTVYNDVFGIAYVMKSETPPWEDLAKRAAESHYDQGNIPIGGLILTAGVDCQIDRVEVQVVAWGSKRRRWVVDYLVIEGNIELDRTQEQLSALLSRTWRDAFGNKRRLDMMAVDSGNWTNAVYEFVLKHPDNRVFAVKGASENGAAPIRAGNFNIPDGRGNTIKTNRNLWLVGVSPLKHTFYQNVKITDPDLRGFVGFPRGLEDNYFVMLTNEQKRLDRNRKTGVTVWRWFKVGDNEAIDNMNYAEAAARRLGWDKKSDDWWDALAAEREVEPEDRQQDLFDQARHVDEEARRGQARAADAKADEAKSRAAIIASKLA